MNTTSIWQQSQNTKQTVLKQILDKYGVEEARRYDPLKNCFTLKGWNERGYKVKAGEKALKSYIFIKYRDSKTGEIKGGMRTINVFFDLQVEKVDSEDQETKKEYSKVIVQESFINLDI